MIDRGGLQKMEKQTELWEGRRTAFKSHRYKLGGRRLKPRALPLRNQYLLLSFLRSADRIARAAFSHFPQPVPGKRLNIGLRIAIAPAYISQLCLHSLAAIPGYRPDGKLLHTDTRIAQ